MRYIIQTNDEEGIIGMALAKWQKEKKLDIVEKGEPIVELKVYLEKIAKALDVLKKAGYNSEIMKSWIYQETKLPKAKVNAVLESQESFFKQIGVLK